MVRIAGIFAAVVVCFCVTTTVGDEMVNCSTISNAETTSRSEEENERHVTSSSEREARTMGYAIGGEAS